MSHMKFPHFIYPIYGDRGVNLIIYFYSTNKPIMFNGQESENNIQAIMVQFLLKHPVDNFPCPCQAHVSLITLHLSICPPILIFFKGPGSNDCATILIQTAFLM